MHLRWNRNFLFHNLFNTRFNLTADIFQGPEPSFFMNYDETEGSGPACLPEERKQTFVFTIIQISMPVFLFCTECKLCFQKAMSPIKLIYHL